MKTKSLLLFATAVAFLTVCGAGHAASKDKQPANPSASGKKAEIGIEAMVGEWELVGFVVDTNDNLQIDEAERQNLKKGMMDYMKLNRDGTGLFTVAKMEGRLEAQETGTGGRKTLVWFDKANGRHRIGTLVKVTKDELQIKEPGGNGLFLWKRL
jgi:hypothetical protein